MTNRQTPKHTGFTIVELLIVIVVIAVLAAITVVAYRGLTQRAQDSAVESNVASLVKKTGELSVVHGGVDPSLLLGSNGGPTVADQLDLLRENGLQMDTLRHPRAGPREVTSTYFNSSYNGVNLLNLPDDATIRRAAPPTPPEGFRDWDFLDSMTIEESDNTAAINEWTDSVYTAMQQWDAVHLWPSDMTHEEEVAANYQILNAYIDIWTNQYPAPSEKIRRYYAGYSAFLLWTADVFADKPTAFIDIPKKNIYIIEVLGVSPSTEDECDVEYTSYPVEDGSGNYRRSASILCGSNLRGSMEVRKDVTGVKIHYYSTAQQKWLAKTYGGGEPFLKYSERLSQGWGW